jgi:hypothetical protein
MRNDRAPSVDAAHEARLQSTRDGAPCSDRACRGRAPCAHVNGCVAPSSCRADVCTRKSSRARTTRVAARRSRFACARKKKSRVQRALDVHVRERENARRETPVARDRGLLALLLSPLNFV